MKTLYKKEINYYLNNPVGYIIVIVFAVFANFLFVKDIFAVGVASMRSFFEIAPWLLMVFVPASSMRIFSEEKRINTLEVLLTLPVKEEQIVLAKFLSLITMVVIALILTLSLPLSLIFLTKIYLPEVFVGYLGLVFFSMMMVSLSMIFSLMTKNQVVAFLSSAIVIFILLVLGGDFFASTLPRFIRDFLAYFSPSYHLLSFQKGLVDGRGLFYFLSATTIFLLINTFLLKNRD
ncbi:MAG: ABC transporter permease [Microgenomates group bacterium]